MTDKNPRGRRPTKSQSDARDNLILAARKCFSSMAYKDVTTRMLAAEAGVNASLIRYYFFNKDGLYQQMLSSVAEEFQNTVEKFSLAHPDNPFEALFRAHMSLSLNNADIPKLIFRELAFNEGKSRHLVVENVAKPNREFINKLFKPFLERGEIREDFDPFILMMCTMSMSIMPHLLRDALEQVDGFTLTPEIAEKIVWQNSQMIQFGCIKRNSNVPSNTNTVGKKHE